ncbi:hypothetical protein [Campylobacter jejuni]|nr:hypothetical protein [Campylobacter jejuni]
MASLKNIQKTTVKNCGKKGTAVGTPSLDFERYKNLNNKDDDIF